MNNDLISRSALKDRAKTMLKIIGEDNLSDYEQGKKYAFETAIDFIDNAPTVFSCNACKNMGNERECVNCHDYSNYVHYEERPQGEWIDEGQYAEGHSEHAYFCKNCNYEIIEKPNMISENRFCKNCGADMRKGGAE